MDEFREDMWREMGWDDLEEAKRWHEAGWGRQLTEEEYKELLNYDEYLREAKEEGLMDEIIDAYLYRYVVGWEDPEEAYRWYLLNLFSPQEALKLSRAGWSAEEARSWFWARPWKGGGISDTWPGEHWLENPEEAYKWYKAGWETAEGAYEFYKAGWRDPEEALKWKEHSGQSGQWRNIEVAFAWFRAGWNDPEEALRWYRDWLNTMQESPDPEVVYKWHKAGWESCKGAFPWYKAGWEDPEEAIKWSKAGWIDPQGALRWKTSGLWNSDSERELRIAGHIYFTLGIKNPAEAKKIMEQIRVSTSRPKRQQRGPDR